MSDKSTKKWLSDVKSMSLFWFSATLLDLIDVGLLQSSFCIDFGGVQNSVVNSDVKFLDKGFSGVLSYSLNNYNQVLSLIK